MGMYSPDELANMRDEAQDDGRDDLEGTTEYLVFQPRLSEMQAAAVNAHGWNVQPETAMYADVTNGNPSGVTILRAVRAGVFSHGWTIKALDMEEAFSLGNYMGGMGTAKKAHARASSMSVGDLLVWTDAAGMAHCHRCEGMGFREVAPFIARECRRMEGMK